MMTVMILKLELAMRNALSAIVMPEKVSMEYETKHVECRKEYSLVGEKRKVNLDV